MRRYVVRRVPSRRDRDESTSYVVYILDSNRMKPAVELQQYSRGIVDLGRGPTDNVGV